MEKKVTEVVAALIWDEMNCTLDGIVEITSDKLYLKPYFSMCRPRSEQKGVLLDTFCRKLEAQ